MRTRSRSRHKIAEPLRIEFHSQEDQFQEDPPEVSMADNRTMAQLLQAPIVGYEDAIEDPPEVSMADNRTMAQLLQAPIVGYEDAIVIPEITTTNFELKHALINLVQNKQFFRHDKEDPHTHIRYFNKITSTMRVPNQIFDESFSEAWDRFNDLLRACPRHEFSELNQLDTFYNALNVNDQDSLNSAAGGNFLDKMPSDCLKIIESKSKVRQSRAKAVVANVNLNFSTPAISSDVTELKDMVRALLLDKKNQSSAPATSPTLLRLKQLSLIVLPAMVLIRTKIVPLPAGTFIKTTSTSMCHKLQQPIIIKETPVSVLRWLQIKSDLPDSLLFKIIRTTLIRGIILLKTEGVISTNLLSTKASFIDHRSIKLRIIKLLFLKRRMCLKLILNDMSKLMTQS
nr:reverse transcriptase domain-containing protein [Tanacetum cinerariifolium]